MPGQVHIHADLNAQGHYVFRVRSGSREITTSVNSDLAASFFEDLRLLRWKSAGIHDEGDLLLNHVGDRLAALIAPPDTWGQLELPDDARQVRVEFSQSAHRLMSFPWELLRINAQFLIGRRGSNLMREVPAPAAKYKKRNPLITVMHVSLGTDSALRLDEERCSVLETIPSSIPIEFLPNPSAGHLDAAVDAFRPRIVIVSGHGHYDDLQREHYLSADDAGFIRTARLVELFAFYGCQLLVLSTCESARLGGPVIDHEACLPADVIAFSFPVRTTTAIESLKCFLQQLAAGETVVDASAAVRAIESDDEYAFFNAVHIHRRRSRSLHVTDANPRPHGPPTTRCPGMELALGRLNSFAHCDEPTTLLAPKGSGGEALIQHWAELVRRSESQAKRWCVILDRAPIVGAEGSQLVRLAHPYSFVPVPAENVVYCDGMDRQYATSLLEAKDHDLAQRIATHPLVGMPGFVDDLMTGRTEREAVEHFEQENRMPERARRLSREGILFASWLFATKSAAAIAFENRDAFAEKMKDFGMEASVIMAGIENAVAATVMISRPEGMFLAPEFMLLGDRWFQNWRTDHRAAFNRLCAAFFTLAVHGKLDVEMGFRLLDWAMRIEDWTTSIMICISVSAWHGEHGQLESVGEIICQLLPYATGLERIILRGHLATIATNTGKYRIGLAENQQVETDLQDLPKDDDYFRNLYASITQQIDCLLALDRIDEAERRWSDAHDLVRQLTEHRSEAEARLLGQLAHIRRERDKMSEALDAASQAVKLAIANDCPSVLIAELRHTRADLLRQDGQEREAVEELNAMANTAMPPALRSRFLHLKSLLLGQMGGPHALEHLLESYQQDRLRGDDGGVAISLLAIARIFTEEHEYQRARERIREALPLADACGLVNITAALALLWGEIDLAEGETSSAATWLDTARNKFAESEDEDGVTRATRLLDTIASRGTSYITAHLTDDPMP